MTDDEIRRKAILDFLGKDDVSTLFDNIRNYEQMLKERWKAFMASNPNISEIDGMIMAHLLQINIKLTILLARSDPVSDPVLPDY
jgi:hypothetical protein